MISTDTWRSLFAEASAGLDTEIEARVVLEEASQTKFSQLFLRFDEHATDGECAKVHAFVSRRRSGEPLQHIVGHWPFRSLELRVDTRALIPRPETEIVVDEVLSALACASETTGEDASMTVVDLGTGAGPIALSIATELPRAHVIGVDASPTALSLAEENRAQLGEQVASRVHFARGNFYSGVPDELRGAVACVVANPPYLAEREWLDLERVVRDFDPYEALVAGPTGYEAIGAVIDGAPSYLRRPGSLVIELAPHQAARARRHAELRGARTVRVARDLAGRERVLVANF